MSRDSQAGGVAELVTCQRLDANHVQVGELVVEDLGEGRVQSPRTLTLVEYEALARYLIWPYVMEQLRA